MSTTPDLPPQPARDPWGAPRAPEPPPPPSGTRRRARWPVAAIAGVLIIGLAFGGYVLTQDAGDSATGPEPPTSTGSVVPGPVNVTDLRANATSFQVTLRWRPGTGDPQPAMLNVYRNDGFLDAVDPAKTTFVDDTAVPGSTYSYRVVPVDGAVAEHPIGAPSVKVKTKPAAPSTARLEGLFNARFTETNRFGYRSSSGSLIKTIGFKFTPACERGPCATALVGLRYNGLKLDLKPSGGVYRGSVSGVKAFARCGNVATTASVTVTVKPTAAKGVDGEWRVTQVTGTFVHRTPSQLGCVSSGGDHTFTAKLI